MWGCPPVSIRGGYVNCCRPLPHEHFSVFHTDSIVRRSLKKKTVSIVPSRWAPDAAVPPATAEGAATRQAGLHGLRVFLSENWIPLPLYSVCDSLGAASVTHCQTTPNEYNRDQKHLFYTWCHGVSDLLVIRSYFLVFVGT